MDSGGGMELVIATAEHPAFDDGLLIAGSQVPQIVVQNKHVRCVDLIGNPQVELIDLRACTTPIHLTVRGSARVHTVLLPQTGVPAVIHWDFGTGAEPLSIHGLLGQFDSCQDDGRTTRILSGPKPFRTALVVPDGALKVPTADAELFVCLSCNLPDAKAPFREIRSLRAAVLNGVDLPEDVEILAEQLQSLTIVAAAKLTTLTLSAPVEVLDIAACPKIAAIIASGTRLRVEGGLADEIRVQGAWATGQFSNTTSRLGLSLIDHLMAFGCRYIQPNRLPLENATNPIGVLPHPDCLFDPKWRALLIGFVHQTSNSTSILPALKLLDLLMHTGLSAEETWVARNRLYANLARPKAGALGEFPWLWATPSDLASEVYEADLVLWIRCRPRSESAKAFDLPRQTFRRTLQIAAVLRMARKLNGTDRAELVAVASASVEGIANRRTAISGQEESAEQMGQSIARIVEALVLLRDDPAVQTTLGQLPALIIRLMPSVSQLAPLSALALLGLLKAKVALLERARSLARNETALAAQFHAAALLPPKTNLLSNIQPTEIAFAV